jgi:RNAse (barnase) inhibitor barstar
MSENLLKDVDASGVFHLPPARQQGIETCANKAHFCVLKTDITERASTEATLLQLGATLDFPNWYGANFDALYDCLTDPTWQPAKGHVLLINGLGHLRKTAPTDFATLIEVLQAVAEARRAMNTPFWALIDTPARGIPKLPEA